MSQAKFADFPRSSARFILWKIAQEPLALQYWDESLFKKEVDILVFMAKYALAMLLPRGCNPNECRILPEEKIRNLLFERNIKTEEDTANLGYFYGLAMGRYKDEEVMNLFRGGYPGTKEQEERLQRIVDEILECAFLEVECFVTLSFHSAFRYSLFKEEMVIGFCHSLALLRCAANPSLEGVYREACEKIWRGERLGNSYFYGHSPNCEADAFSCAKESFRKEMDALGRLYPQSVAELLEIHC